MKLTETIACQHLGLEAPSNAEEARKAYRSLARKLHPDIGGDEERFKQVSAAYQFLSELYESNPNRDRPQNTESSKDHQEAWRAWRAKTSGSGPRRAYGTRQDQRPGAQVNPETQDSYVPPSENRDDAQASPSQSVDAEILSAYVVPNFRDKLEGWSRVLGDRITELSQNTSQKVSKWYRESAKGIFERGKDETLKLEIDMNTLLYGRQQRIAVNRKTPCPQCQMEEGVLITRADQPAIARAEGCNICRGEARISTREELSVYIPPGADQGHKLKVPLKGRSGLNGADDGDLYLSLSPPALSVGYSRKGSNLNLDLAIPALVMKRGGPVTLAGPRGPLTLKIPQNSRSGRKLAIAQQGLAVWGKQGEVGTLIVTLRLKA